MKKYLILLFLFISQKTYALENEYDSFGGRTISDASTLGDYILYYFNFFLVVAAGAAFIIIIFAGINYLISGDNFTKRLTAKKMIFNALIGLLIALGSVTILNTISPGNTVIPELNSQDYSEGINLIREGDNKTWVNDNVKKVAKDYNSIDWISPSEDLPAIYIFETPDYTGFSQEILNGSSVFVPENSSIWFLWNKPGSYILYDSVDFKKGNKDLPLSLTKDKTSLAVDLFDNITRSIKINQPKNDSTKEYGLILFTEERFEGTCVWSFNDISDLSIDKDPENHLAIGLDQLSSIKKIIGSTEKGAQITIYNRANCQNLEHDKSSKKCTINTSKTNINIIEECLNQQVDFRGEEVLSINFDSDNAGVLLKANNGNCQYFEKKGVNTCISLIKYGNIYDPKKDILPEQLTLFSLDK
jgi:hypothetical protein